MSVLIKGIDKPKNSRECLFAVMAEDWGKECIVGGEYHWDNERICEGCPLVEVPLHGRLIDANELYEKISLLFHDVNSTEDFMGIGYNHGVGDALAIIKNFLAIIEAEEGEAHEQN